MHCLYTRIEETTCIDIYECTGSLAVWVCTCAMYNMNRNILSLSRRCASLHIAHRATE